MSKTVLIIDDQEAAAVAVAEACQAIGLQTVVVTSPGEAKKAFLKQPVDLVVIDLFLPGTDGFAVGKEIRATPAGAIVPIIAVSGVLKQSTVRKEVFAQLKGDFLPKPFDVKALQELVSQRLGLVAPGGDAQPRAQVKRRAIPQAQSFQSDLRRDPVYRILARLYEQRAGGHLDLIRGKARRRLTFHQGRLRFAVSNLKQENIGGMQVAKGTMEESVFAEAVKTAQARKVPLGEALVANKVMTKSEMDSALAEQVRAIAIGALAWADGEARFEIDPQGAMGVPDHPVHPLEMVVHGIARHYTPDTIKTFLDAHRPRYVHRTDLLDREKFILRKTSPGEQITLAITGVTTLGELLDKAREQDLALLFALVGTGLVKLKERPQTGDEEEDEPAAAPAPTTAPAARQQAAPRAPAAPSISQPEPATDEDRKAVAEIAAEHQRISNADLFEVLGVKASADAAAVQAAYKQAAGTWHVDRFAGRSLGDGKRKIEEIFARIGEAKETLLDANKRCEYEVYLDRKAKGLPTDVNAILAAEGCFEDGGKLLRAGKADKALDKFEEAISLNDSEPEYFAWRGYARFRSQGESARDAAKADIDRALKADSNMTAATFFLGMMAMQDENLDEATSLFKRVLVNNPQHTEAAQQLRLIKARSEKKGGLFDKLFKK